MNSSTVKMLFSIPRRAFAHKPSIKFVGKRTPEYYADLESGHDQESHSTQQTGEKYVHEFSSIPRNRLTPEEIDAINLGSMEISDWKKIKPVVPAGTR